MEMSLSLRRFNTFSSVISSPYLSLATLAILSKSLSIFTSYPHSSASLAASNILS